LAGVIEPRALPRILSVSPTAYPVPAFWTVILVVVGLYVVPGPVSDTVITALAPVAEDTTVGTKFAKVLVTLLAILTPDLAKPPAVFRGAPVTPPVVAASYVGATVN
jgi:hypothetical protein